MLCLTEFLHYCIQYCVILNSSPPSGTYMRQGTGWALVPIMACRLFGTKPLSKPILGYCELDPYEQISVKFNQNTNIFIQENAFKNIVCETGAILSGGRWVKCIITGPNCIQTCTLQCLTSEKQLTCYVIILVAIWSTDQTPWMVERVKTKLCLT